MRQQVGAVAVVVVVRHHLAHLVQRAGPAQLAACLGVGPGQAPYNSASATCATRRPAPRRPRSALQFGHRGVAQVVAPLALRLQAFVQVDDHALAQRPLGRQQRVDAEVRGQRVQDGQAAGQHGACGRASGRAGRCGRRCRPQMQRSMHQRRPSGVMRPSVGRWPAAAATPRRPCPTSPAPAASCGREGLQRLFEFGAGGHLGGAEGLAREAAIFEEAHRQADASPPNDSATRGMRPWPRISSVERPPMSTTSRGSSLGCR
jgi:hypothetical protein